MKKIGSLQQKILLLLEGGLALGLSVNPNQYFRILGKMGVEWNKINKQSLRRAIRSLYASKLVSCSEQPDGSVKIILTENGKSRALVYKLETMRVKRPKYWDKKWRVIVFDIPEHSKNAREVIRRYLKQFGFYQLQRSVFVIPFECGNEIDFLIEFYNVRKYVRQFIATGVDNELHLKDIFNLD